MNRIIYALAALFILQLFALGVRALSSSESAAQAVRGQKLCPGITVDQIGAMVIAEKKESNRRNATSDLVSEDRIELKRESKGFVVTTAADYPTDGDKVDKLLEKLVGLASEGVVAREAASHGGLGVKEGQADRDVILKDTRGEVLARLYLGRAIAGGQFVRVHGDDEVHRVGESLTWQASVHPSSYIDTQIMTFEMEKAREITWKKGEETTLAFTRASKDGAEPAWTATKDGFTADKTKVEAVLRTLSHLRFQDPIAKESKPEHGLGDTAMRIVVKLESDEEVELLLGAAHKGKNDDEGRLAQVKGNPFVVALPKWTVEQLEKSADHFKPEVKAPPPAAEEDSLPIPTVPDEVAAPSGGDGE